MSQFCSIQELSSFEGSEASPLIINPAPVNLAKLDLNTNRHSDSDTMTSSTKTCEEKSPTLEGLVFNSDLDTIVRKGKRDYQEGLLIYKHLKETTFFKDFKLQFNKDLRTIEALMYLSRVIRYEYHMPRSVIYKKGDLSNQKVYIVYSGEVNVWAGKPDGNALKLGSHKSSEPQETTPKVSNDNLQLLKIKSGGFGGGNTKIRRRQNRVIDKLKRVTSTETPKAIMTQTAPKARTLKKQFTFDGFFSHPNVTKLSEINTNSRTLTEDSEVNSREILHARPPGAERRSVEPSGKEKKVLDYGLSRRRLNSNLLANPLTLNIKDSDEQASFTPESCGGEYGFPSRSANKDGIDMDMSGRGSSETGKDSHFVLRKVNFKRANTFNLDLTTSTPMNGNNTSMNRNTSEGGYIKETIRKGGHFGDEILRSSQPREDTIVTSTPCELLVFNVEAYEYLMTRFERTNTQVMNFLMDYIPGLEEALNQKKITRPDLYFKEEIYQLHNHVMIEGNKGKKLYLLFEGTCQVLKSLNGPSKNKGPRKSYTTSGEMVICNIQPGVFIGEEILFNQEGEYEYTIKAASAQVKVLAISAQSFKESMPKLANQTLESLYFSKKQKNLEIMDTRMDFSKDLEKLQQAATSPKNSDVVVQMQTKIIKTQNQVYGTRHYQEKPEPVVSKHSYTVEFALPGGREGSKLLTGLKFKRYPNQTPEPQARKVSISVEKEELMRTEPEQPLSEMEKKLRRYLHQGFIKKSVTPKGTTCSSKDGEVSFKNLKTQGSFEEYSGNKENYTSNTIQRLSLGLGKEKKERARENSFSRLKEAERSVSNGRRTFGGFGERTLSQIMAQVSPTREKFVGDLPVHLKKLHAPRFSQGLQKNGNMSKDNLKIKVNVDVKTKRVTYGVASVKPKQHNSTKSQGFNSENNEVLLSVKTASMTRSERQLKSRLSERRTGSMRETPEQFMMLGESGMEGRLTEKLKGLGRISINAKMDECK